MDWELEARRQAAFTRFVLTELEVGLQFAVFAQEAHRAQNFLRGAKCKAGAVSALESVKTFLSQAAPSLSEQSLINRQLDELENAVANL